MENTSIQKSTEDNKTEILSLYQAAFPEEDLLPLVHDLLGAKSDVFSIVAKFEDKIVGHAALTVCSIDETAVALLGPIAVLPEMQKQGIGSSLIYEGINILKSEGLSKVCVLGDPNYYKRFGFAGEQSITTPYPIPEEWKDAWQSMDLNEKNKNLEGVLKVPAMWQQPELWSE